MKNTQLINELHKLTTKEKRQVLNALCFNEGGYELSNPNTLMEHFGVSAGDLMLDIKAEPNWILGAGGFIPDIQLIVGENTINKCLEKYPNFDIKFTQSILNDLKEMNLKEMKQAKQDYKKIYQADDKAYKFIELMVASKKRFKETKTQ